MATRRPPEIQESEAQRFDRQRETIHRDMLSAVSHDLKTPLASIIGSLEIYERMKQKLTPEKQETLIGTALQEAYRLDNFISNILDMAKLEGGMVKAKQEICHIEHMLHDCLTKMGHRLFGVDLRIKSLSGNITVHTDSLLLCRALCLILDNAVKYGGAGPVIKVDYGTDGENAFIRIHDNGPGVPEGRHEEIFSKYTRIAKQDHQNAGTGLGLSICRSLVKLLDGTVQVQNDPEGGAVFTVKLPAN